MNYNPKTLGIKLRGVGAWVIVRGDTAPWTRKKTPLSEAAVVQEVCPV